MYLRQILHNCARIEDETGRMYDELAELHAGNNELAEFWKGLASDERFHARVLKALSAIMEVDVDDGPFLVTMQSALDRERAKLDEARARVSEGVTELEAQQITAAIEQTELLTVYPELFVMVQERMRGFSRLLDRPDETMGHGHRLDKLESSIEKAAESSADGEKDPARTSRSARAATSRAN